MFCVFFLIFIFLQFFMMNQLCNDFLTNHSIEKSSDVLPRLIVLTIPNQLFDLEAFKSSLTMPSHHLHFYIVGVDVLWSNDGFEIYFQSFDHLHCPKLYVEVESTNIFTNIFNLLILF